MLHESPLIYRLDLPDLHTRDGARDDKTLNFTGPLEDREGIRVMYNSPDQRLFLRRLDPEISDKWVI
jgi:hypothetical protein